MKATISISSSYGFDHNWTLICITDKVTKSFYLGQDVKFCSRVLGMDVNYVIEQIGTNRLDTEKAKRKLAKFICKTLGLNGHNIKKIEPWGLCSQ